MTIVKARHACMTVGAALLLAGCASAEGNTPAERTLFAMDTYMTVTAYGENADKAADECIAEISRLDKLWNVTAAESDIYRVNTQGTAQVSADTAELIRFALGMNGSTGGALDITLYPVLREWGFTTGEYRVPDEETITKLLQNTGAEKVSVESDTVSLPQGYMLDLGSVGKGEAGSRAAEILRQNGVTSALLDLGGNIQTVGRKPDGGRWKIGLKDPRGRGIYGVIETEDSAVVTSGGYERYFEQDGMTYHHILDPNTGRPADSGIISATVTGSDGRLCDALSTALFVMGEERAADYWRANGGFEFLLVTDDDRLLISEGAESAFTSKGLYTDIEVIRRE